METALHGSWDLPRREAHERQHPTITDFEVALTRLPPCDWAHDRFHAAPISPLPLNSTVPPSSPLSWSEHIDSLPSWEGHLLSTITFLNEDSKPLWSPALLRNLTFAGTFNADDLCDLFSTDSSLIAISDGGCIEDLQLGSCGWVLGDKHQIYVAAHSMALGKPMQSFRAEGYGILSVLRFLIQFTEYNDIHSSSIVHLYYDNSQSQFSSALRADWVIIQEIIASYKQIRSVCDCPTVAWPVMSKAIRMTKSHSINSTARHNSMS